MQALNNSVLCTLNDSERHAKIQKTLKRNFAWDNTSFCRQAGRPTTVVCFHASVAQKSYGKEKRLLCPPPMVKIDGPLSRSNIQPSFSMSIVGNEGQSVVQEYESEGRASPTRDTKAVFRNLYVNNELSSKLLKFDLGMGPPNSPDHLFASFKSEPVSIISKPSKKTIKARSTQSCLFEGDIICLFNRVNAQSVRTKYLSMREGLLGGNSTEWSAFVIRSVSRPSVSKGVLSNENVIPYGSHVILTDVMTGMASEPLLVRKVDKHDVILDETGPISQLQKLCLVKTTQGSSDIYLSGANYGLHSGNAQAVMTQAANNRPITLSADDSYKKYNKHEYDEDQSQFAIGRDVLAYKPPREAVVDHTGKVTSHKIDDSMTWTVIGISYFSYSFFNVYDGEDVPMDPERPITPFPLLKSRPLFNAESRKLMFSISNFIQPVHEGVSAPLELWLGPIGPLPVKLSPIAREKPATQMETLLAQAGVTSLLGISLAGVIPSAEWSAKGWQSDQNCGKETFDPPAEHNTIRVDVTLPNYADMLASIDPTQGPSLIPTPALQTDSSTNPFDFGGTHTSPVTVVPPLSPGASSESAATEETDRQWTSPTSTLKNPLPASAHEISLPLVIVRPTDGIAFVTGKWIVSGSLGNVLVISQSEQLEANRRRESVSATMSDSSSSSSSRTQYVNKHALDYADAAETPKLAKQRAVPNSSPSSSMYAPLHAYPQNLAQYHRDMLATSIGSMGSAFNLDLGGLGNMGGNGMNGGMNGGMHPGMNPGMNSGLNTNLNSSMGNGLNSSLGSSLDNSLNTASNNSYGNIGSLPAASLPMTSVVGGGTPGLTSNGNAPSLSSIGNGNLPMSNMAHAGNMNTSAAGALPHMSLDGQLSASAGDDHGMSNSVMASGFNASGLDTPGLATPLASTAGMGNPLAAPLTPSSDLANIQNPLTTPSDVMSNPGLMPMPPSFF